MRPQGKTKLGAYFTPPLVAQAIARFLRAKRQDAQFRVLDPCAGDGKAAALLVKCLKDQHEREQGRWADFEVSAYGIEIQSVYAPLADEQLTHVLQSSFFATTLSHGDSADRGWQLLHLNPPYDDDVEAAKGERKEREEFKFLKRATLLLSAYGILDLIVPQYVLCRAGVARFLAQHYEQHSCFRFPDLTWRPPGSTADVSMYGQFKQVVFFGCKRPKALPYSADDAELTGLMAQIEAWANMGDQLAPLPMEANTTGSAYAIPNAPEGVDLKYFLKGSFEPDSAAAAVGQFSAKTKRPARGVWASEDYWSARFPDPRKIGLAVGHPLHKFKRGYLIVFAVAGLLNRAVLTGKDGRRILVKGHTRKTAHYSCQDGDWEKVEKVTDRFESSLWCTDLATGDLVLVETGGSTMVEWNIEYTTMSMQEFLENFGDSIMLQVSRLNTPRYQSARQVPWARQGFSLIKRKPLGKQLDVILAQVHSYVNRWREGGIDDDELVLRIGEVAEMASGKTYMAICTAFLADLYACGAADLASRVTKQIPFFPAIVLAPSIMAPKWKREIEMTIPNARVLIVERFGSLHDLEEEDDDEELLGERSSKKAFSDASQAFRQFDPDFMGTSLGTVGSVDRAIARIEGELAAWQREYDRVQEANRALCEANGAGELKPLPLKPCHVLVLTFNTAKLMPPWMPVYQLKPVRTIDRDSGKLKLQKRLDGSAVLIPCCPSCGRAIKEEKRAAREFSKHGSTYSELQIRLEKVRRERATSGQRLGMRLNSYEGRLRDLLSSNDAYRALDTRREELLYELADLQERQLLEVRGNPQQTSPATTNMARTILRQQFDHEVLQMQEELAGCQEQMEQLLAHLAETDEQYAQLVAALVELRAALPRQQHYLSTFEEEAAEPVYLYLSEGELLGTKDHRVKRACTECGEPLWQYVPKKPKAWTPFSATNFLPVLRQERPLERSVLQYCTGTHHVQTLPLPGRDLLPACVKSTYRRRWAIADYIADHYPGIFKFLIADEMHEGADGTALDQARQLLSRACGRMIGLTGTLSNGYASSLFRLFYVIMRQVRQQYQYDAVKQWIRDHGKMQMVQKSKYEEPPTGSGSDSKRKISPGMPVYREVAGFGPAGMGLVAMRSTLTELREVVPDLVGYTEEIRFVDMGQPLGDAYSIFEAETTAILGKLLAQGDNSALAPWYAALLIYPDLPWLGWTCKTRRDILLGVAPALPEDFVYPVERALIDYVQEQHQKGYPVLVYTENTGQYDDQERLQYLFETKVRGRGGKKLKVAILRSTTTKKTMDREAWLARCVEEGVDVLICNPALVKTGLDLIYFPRIAYKRVPRKVNDLRQSSRRSLRPGQNTDIEVVFFAYKGSMAMRLLYLMARKTQSSLLVEGRIETEGLVSLGFDEEEDEGEIMARMAREMLAALKAGTLGDTSQIAAELQELTRQTIEIERKQNVDGEEEDLEARVVLEAIRTAPVVATADFYGDAASTPVPGGDGAMAATGAPAVAAEPLDVTIVPVSVTEDPWASAFAVQASQDVWAALRQQLGPKKRGGRKR